MKKLFIILLLLSLTVNVSGGTISRLSGNFTSHDEVANLDKLNNQLETIYTEFNGGIDYDNFEDEGIRNADIDSDECFTQESWNNAIDSGHFPTWSNGTSAVPDDWTAELTATVARDTKATYAPTGFYSIKITGAGADLEGIYQTFNCRASYTYVVTLKTKVTAGDVARISIDDDGSMDAVTHDYSDTSWQTENNKKYFTFTTATDSTTITVKLLAKNDTDVVWFTEVQMTEGRLQKGFQYQSTNADTVDSIHAAATPEASKLLALTSVAEFTGAALGIGKGANEVITGSTATAAADPTVNLDDAVSITTKQTSTIMVWLTVRSQQNGAGNINYFKIRRDGTTDITPIISETCHVLNREYTTTLMGIETGVAAGTLSIQAMHSVSAGTNTVNSGEMLIITIPE